MQYASTRGTDRDQSFTDVLIKGLARDGGLFMPETWPEFSRTDISDLAGLDYAEVAVRIVSPFVGDSIPHPVLERMCETAYGKFAHRAVAPLTQLGPEDWILELFRGPTLAFKDFAMLLLGQLFEYVLRERGERLTIVGATSGDTGSAAIEALKGLTSVDVFILHPEGRVSETQRRMMTSVQHRNIHNIAVKGTFDDCQAVVKAMFADPEFSKSVRMGAINSINWARIMAQTVYYFTSAISLGGPEKNVSYVVPTGNFGDVFAGYVAARMGLSIDVLCIATNRNDILRRTLETGRYEPMQTHKTISPSMDIQVSSNFERLIFEAVGGDATAVTGMMSDLAVNGEFTLSDNVHATMRQQFAAYMADEAETSAMISSVYKETAMLVDPHTAVGLVAANKARKENRVSGPVVTLSTAHPAKFPEAVKAATGQDAVLPPNLSDLFSREEQYTVMANDLATIQQHILGNI